MVGVGEGVEVDVFAGSVGIATLTGDAVVFIAVAGWVEAAAMYVVMIAGRVMRACRGDADATIAACTNVRRLRGWKVVSAARTMCRTDKSDNVLARRLACIIERLSDSPELK